MTDQSDSTDDAADLRYGEALEELNGILEGIEEDRFDLEELGEQVNRAAALIRTCRDKIDATELQIQSIIDDLDEDED